MCNIFGDASSLHQVASALCRMEMGLPHQDSAYLPPMTKEECEKYAAELREEEAFSKLPPNEQYMRREKEKQEREAAEQRKQVETQEQRYQDTMNQIHARARLLAKRS